MGPIYFDLENGSKDNILLESGTYKLLIEYDSIVNAQATSVGVETRPEIDDRTGFKLYPAWHPLSKTVEDGYGWRTNQPDSRHPQEFVKARGNDKADGPQNAEPDDSFVVYLIYYRLEDNNGVLQLEELNNGVRSNYLLEFVSTSIAPEDL